METMHLGHHVVTIMEDARRPEAQALCRNCLQAAKVADLLRDESPPWLQGPCPKCPTCRGESRETVGMVCQTCGTDYGAVQVEKIPDPLEGLTPAESLGVLVTQTVHQVELERDEANGLVARLTVALGSMIELVERQGITWAKDDAAVASARDLLEEVESDQSPEQEPTP